MVHSPKGKKGTGIMMLFGNSFENVVTNDMDCKVIATSSALSHLHPFTTMQTDIN